MIGRGLDIDTVSMIWLYETMKIVFLDQLSKVFRIHTIMPHDFEIFCDQLICGLSKVLVKNCFIKQDNFAWRVFVFLYRHLYHLNLVYVTGTQSTYDNYY